MIFLAIMAPPFTNTDLQGVRQLPSNESGRSFRVGHTGQGPTIIVGFDERASQTFQADGYHDWDCANRAYGVDGIESLLCAPHPHARPPRPAHAQTLHPDARAARV